MQSGARQALPQFVYGVVIWWIYSLFRAVFISVRAALTVWTVVKNIFSFGQLKIAEANSELCSFGCNVLLEFLIIDEAEQRRQRQTGALRSAHFHTSGQILFSPQSRKKLSKTTFSP